MKRTAILGAMTLGLLAVLAAGPAQPGGLDGKPEAPWLGHLRAMDQALHQRDVRGAEGAWHQAYLAGLGAWEWNGMADVADAYVRLVRLSSPGPAAMAKARNLYLAALFRARQQRSVEGVLRAAEGFARVGDRAAAEQALRVAESVATEIGDAQAPARIRAIAATLPDVLAVPPQAGR